MELVPTKPVPKGQNVLCSLWSMKRKCDIKTGEVYKYKACLNVHGGRQEYAVNFYETFSPGFTWITIRLLLILSMLNNRNTKQVDFVLAYPSAPIEFKMYMKLPKGIKTKYGNGRTHILQLLKNLYRQKQAGKVWNDYLVTVIGFKQSKVDELFFTDDVLFIIYVDDGIFAFLNQELINKAIQNIQKAGYEIDDQGSLTDYLGFNNQPRQMNQTVTTVVDWLDSKRCQPTKINVKVTNSRSFNQNTQMRN